MDDLLRTLARETTARGEIALRERHVGTSVVHELIVNGAFAMDSVEVASERALADALLPAARVLLGGLGLGFTAARLMAQPVKAVTIAEIEGPLIAWARAGLTPQLAQVAADPRVELLERDIGDLLVEKGELYDAIALDVDNGPDFLVHQHNAALYQPDLLQAAVDRLRPAGVLVIWCQHRSEELEQRLAHLGAADLIEVPITRDGHRISYALHRVRKSAGVQAE